jgi:hypothetical protein
LNTRYLDGQVAMGNLRVRPEQAERRRRPLVTCLLALAHRFEELVRSGEVKDYADLARLGGVSRARVSQILKLRTLAPPIQELILDLPPRAPGEKTIAERHLRKLLCEPRWDRQRIIFTKTYRITSRLGPSANASRHSESSSTP